MRTRKNPAPAVSMNDWWRPRRQSVHWRFSICDSTHTLSRFTSLKHYSRAKSEEWPFSCKQTNC